MNTDKLVISIIVVVTIAIFGFILFTSVKTPVVGNLDPQKIIGNDPHFIGTNPSESKLVIVEFSDFECPYCAYIAPEIESLSVDYKDITFVYRHFPLSIHQYSLSSAKASEAAAKQGKFWEYVSKLFSNQPDFQDEKLFEYAEALGLNIDQFKLDYQSVTVASAVKEDLDLSIELNLSGTPSFYGIYEGKVEPIALGNTTLTDYVKSKLGESESGKAVEITFDVELQAKVINAIELNYPDLKIVPTEITKITEEEWANSSLGCPQEGMNYAEVITPGYLVEVVQDESYFKFHTNKDLSTIVKCN